MHVQTKAPLTARQENLSLSDLKSRTLESAPHIMLEQGADKVLSVTIESPRLLIRSVERSDAREYHDYLFSDRAVMRSFATGEVRDMSYVEARLDAWCERWESGDPCSAYAIRDKTGEFIGHFSLGHGYLPGHLELGYALRPSMWGQGFGSEAVKTIVHELAPLLRAYGFSIQERALSVLNATIRPENVVSAKILTGLGMQELAVDQDCRMPRRYFQSPISLPDQSKGWEMLVLPDRTLTREKP